MSDGDPCTDERLAELSQELGFLDLCELVRRYAEKTTMRISWKHAIATVSVNTRRKATGPKRKKAR